jgi:hypothetical protein
MWFFSAAGQAAAQDDKERVDDRFGAAPAAFGFIFEIDLQPSGWTG